MGKQKQAGLSMSGFLLWCVIFAIVALLGFKLGPPYVEDQTIRKHLRTVSKEASSGNRKEVEDAYSNRAQIDRIDVISPKGEYLGGSIFPGIEISLEALFQRAAGLRRVELVEPRSVIGKSTVESLQSGALYGYASMIDGMCERIFDEIGEARVISTGGLGALIAPLTKRVSLHDSWVTLHGLRLIGNFRRAENPTIFSESMAAPGMMLRKFNSQPNAQACGA